MTVRQIQAVVRRRHGFVPQSCWIADVKEREGWPVRPAWNRVGQERENPCPASKRGPIREALIYGLGLSKA